MRKERIVITSLLTSLCICSVVLNATYGQAASSLDGQGSVSVVGTETTPPKDPENPGVEVDPGPGPSTKGDLRIDFVSSLNFGAIKITENNRKYDSLAQLFHSDTPARGYYIQITDQRGGTEGWNLTLKQERQFESRIIQDLEHQQLDGAVLSFDKGWANSIDSGTPTVTRDTLAINQMGTAYTVATATSGQGAGVWLISFGASGENNANQENTLTAVTDEKGEPVLDATYNKPVYRNSAVSLSVPVATKIYPVQYTTTLTWTLEAGPTS
ncbi:WxL domain-containing protein [Enterococcus sp. HY326]|uniref:WxL domain-containing protein n=1 Tax=Enterococcus sp. HY326 TaxID=2971265 RepID=UPI00223F0CB5|nr:WxL domain-containing protein [Enterococcus sp. HY326]